MRRFLRLQTSSCSFQRVALRSTQIQPRVRRSDFLFLASNNNNTSTALRFHSDHLTGDRSKPPIPFTIVLPDGATEVPVQAYEGQTLVDVTTEHDIAVEAACAQSCACSTCHMYLPNDVYETLEEPSDKENDMLDLAFHCEPTSRLGCQVKVERSMEGMKVRLPKATRNMAVDGYVAKPH